MTTNQMLYVLFGILLGVFAVPYAMGLLKRNSA